LTQHSLHGSAFGLIRSLGAAYRVGICEQFVRETLYAQRPIDADPLAIRPYLSGWFPLMHASWFLGFTIFIAQIPQTFLATQCKPSTWFDALAISDG
jgi:hypothetical protein